MRDINKGGDQPSYLGWLPLLAVIGFLFLGNIGYGTLIWVVTAELLPPKVQIIINRNIFCINGPLLQDVIPTL